MEEFSYEYPTVRDVVFVLGAGASAPDGVPLQKDILPHICGPTHPELAASETGKTARGFLQRWFPRSSNDAPFASLEEVFGFIDLLINQKQGLPDGYTLEALVKVRSALVVCIHYVIDRVRARSPDNYRQFWTRIGENNRNIAIVSLNYDSTLEDAFASLYPNIALIDYSVSFLNYEMPEGVHPSSWWIDATKPIQRWPGGGPVPIKVLKVHGSLNWKYCRSCREVLLTPSDTSIDLADGGFLRFDAGSCFGPETVSMLRCPYCSGPFQTLISPPSHAKELTHPVLSQLLTEAMRELRRARRVVFVGYSFPEADVHIRALLAKEMPSKEIVVIDPHLSVASMDRYRTLSDRVHFLDVDFARVVESDLLSDLLRVSPQKGE